MNEPIVFLGDWYQCTKYIHTYDMTVLYRVKVDISISDVWDIDARVQDSEKTIEIESIRAIADVLTQTQHFKTRKNSICYE